MMCNFMEFKYFNKLSELEKKKLCLNIRFIMSKINIAIFKNREKFTDFLRDACYNYEEAISAEYDEEDAMYRVVKQHGAEYNEIVNHLLILFETFKGIQNHSLELVELFYISYRKRIGNL